MKGSLLFLILCYILCICYSKKGFYYNKVRNGTIYPYVEDKNDNINALSHVRYRNKDDDYDYCQKPAKCEILNSSLCMGVKLPYHSISLNLTDLNTQEKVQEKLQFYSYLKFVPKCWAVIQPFLCALYLPKCESEMVDLPSREMCKITLGPCKIFYDSSVFPSFLNCDDEELFPSKCKNDIHEVKFNTTGSCLDPLIKTDKQEWFYPDIEGCGLKCKDSFYTENEHFQIQKLTAYCVLFCMLCTLFTVVTFIIDWKTANKYPALAIFYVNVCFFISYSGWFIQFLGVETREDILCKKDGTLRKSEPSATENLSCVIVFVMVYYFLIAGLVWFVIFSYAWHMTSLQALGKIQERVDKKRAYFHLVAWSFPLILTITTMALGEIDADYVTGICFVGFVTMAARVGLLLTPLAAAMMLSGYIIIRGLILLIKVKIESREIISQHSSSKIRSNIVRMGVFTLFMIVFCIITFLYHSYISSNQDIWQKSLQTYILCKLTTLGTDYSHCKQESRPSVAMLQLQLLAVFGAGVAMASWVWCTPTLHAWARYIRRKFHCEEEKPIRLQKHKIIAQAFAKRRIFNEGGKISIDCQMHTDPVGLHFDLNSAASNELSTTWAANLPRLVNRRGAVPNEVTYSVSSNNQSIDSELSLNVRHVSIESRRNSGDSQVSVQIAELKAIRKVNRRPKKGYRYKRRERRKRDSTTSLDSHMQIINALTNTSEVKNFGPNLSKRRTGNAGLDGQHINNLLSKGKLVIPYNVPAKSGSEDENVSVTISESKFNMVVSNHNNLDLNDQLVIESLRKGLHIEEIDSTSSEEDKPKKYKDAVQEKLYVRAGRESRSSRRSRQSKKSRRKYSSHSSSLERNQNSDTSSCSEIKQLVQSSYNSGVSAGEKNRSSRQSKTSSIDVAVQTNSQDLEMHPISHTNISEKSYKSKQAKTRDNKLLSKDNYKDCGDLEESTPLKPKNDSNRKHFDKNDDEYSLIDRHNVKVTKSRDYY